MSERDRSLRQAGEDILAGLSRRWLWGTLGRNDLRQRYSGSLIGSLWITANIALMTGCLCLIFAGPLGGEIRHYAPYVAIGLVLWQFMAACLNEATQLFVVAAETIRNAALPLSVHVLRLTWRNLLIMAHGFVIVPALLLIFAVVPAGTLWTVLPAMLLLCFALFWASLLLALLGARFRDVAPIVANLLQLLFFLTPVFWLPGTLEPRLSWLAAFNPFFAFIDIVRAPLLGHAPVPFSWAMALAVAFVAAAAGILALARFRGRVAYWI